MGIKWTDEQKQAIEAKDRSIIVSAAAGSGKTTVLIEKLIRIISDTKKKTNVEDLIVVTFTNAAAAEMKQRLSKALSKKLSENPSDAWLLRQHMFLSSASISTISAFCFELIRENTSKLSIGSDFRILEESEEKLYAATILNELLNELYETSPDKIKILRDEFCCNSDDNLVGMISVLYKNIISIPFFDKWMDKCNDFYNNAQNNEQLYIKNANIRPELDELRTQFIPVMNNASAFNEQAVTDRLNADLLTIDGAILAFDKSGYLAMVNYLEANKFEDFPRATAASKNYREQRDEVKNDRKKVVDAVKALMKHKDIVSNSAADHKKNKEIMEILFSVICEFDKKLYEYKLEKNVLSFDDGERMALSLLGEYDENGNIVKTPLAQELSDRYHVIMIDEYQDSNNRQDMIFKLLSKNGSADIYGSNLFFVGDVKQSIYRFRQANPDNFINVMETFDEYKENDDKNAFINLSTNHRSSQEVVDFVNYIFSHIMKKDMGDINYDKSQELVCRAEMPPAARDTHIIMYDKKNETYGESSEALCVAAKIREMLDNHVQVSVDKETRRDCTPKDFCIITRTKKYNNIYTQALAAYGLDANCEVDGYLKSREISVLINILKILDNPLQDIPLTSVLMSPMFMLDADELAQIRLVNPKKRLFRNISFALEKDKDYKKDSKDENDTRTQNEIESENDIKAENEIEAENGTETKSEPIIAKDSPLYSKLVNFYDLITDLRMISSFSALTEIIQMIYDRTDYMSVISLYKDAERKRANLRMLLEHANLYEKSNNGGIGGFVRYIDKMMENEGDLKSVGGESTVKDAVTIMTMHKSKGLEYPFVFVAETKREFSNKEEKNLYRFSADIGVGFKFLDKVNHKHHSTIPFELIKKYNHIKKLGEEMRLLYVSLTRAKEQLFITVDVSETAVDNAAKMAEKIINNSGITSDLTGSVKGIGDWLLMMLITHKNADPLRQKLQISSCYQHSDNTGLSFEEMTPSDEYEFIADVTENDENGYQTDEEKLNQIREAFNFEYDNSHVNVVSKLSVSDISKGSDDVKILLSKPNFCKDEELKGAERGTAVHTFMQFADFSKLSGSFEQEKQRLINNGYINKKQAEVVLKEDVDAFLNSDLYKKIQNAENVHKERKFLIAIDDLELGDEFAEQYKGTDGMLNGIMDMVIENKDHVILVDYKTDRVNKLEKLVDLYSKQLLLYKKALEKIQKKPVKEAIIYSFCLNDEIVVPLD